MKPYVEWVEHCAEEIWKAEALRARREPRSVSWEDGVLEEDKAKYRFVAEHLWLHVVLPFVEDYRDLAIANLTEAHKKGKI